MPGTYFQEKPNPSFHIRWSVGAQYLLLLLLLSALNPRSIFMHFKPHMTVRVLSRKEKPFNFQIWLRTFKGIIVVISELLLMRNFMKAMRNNVNVN